MTNFSKHIDCGDFALVKLAPTAENVTRVK